VKPNVFRFQELAPCLKALVDEALEQGNLSLRDLAKKLDWSPGLLSLILSGKRGLSAPRLQLLVKEIPGLDRSEKNYIEKLRRLKKAKGFDDKRSEFRKATRLKAMQHDAPENYRMFHYLSDWVRPVVREAIALEDFQLDPEWIQDRLRTAVPVGQVREAIEYLLEYQFIEKIKDGRYKYPGDRAVHCDPTVLRLALGQYHQEMLKQAAHSIDTVPKDERNIAGLTMALSQEGFDKIQRVLLEALDKIEEIQKSCVGRDRVYHVSTVIYPVTKKKA
jgi:uncharacterized protein (TIGR02147 family)